MQIQKSLNTQLFQLRHQGADRIRAEHLKLENELKDLGKAGADPEMIERLLFGAAAVRDDKLTQLADREKLIAEQRKQANQRVIDSLNAETEALAKTDRQRFVSQASRRLSVEATEKQIAEAERLAGVLYDERRAEAARDQARETVAGLKAELAALTQTDRQRFISVALKRLSAEATITERREVERLAGALYDEQQAMARREEARALTERLRTAQEAYADEMSRLRGLRDLEKDGIDQETFARASENAYDRMLDASRKWSDGVQRAIRDYLDEAGDAAKQFERVTTRALQASEDAFVQWAQTGKFSAKDLFNTIAEKALRAAYRMAVVAPLNNILDTIFVALAPTPAVTGGPYAGAAPGTAPVIPVYSVPLPAPLLHTGGVIGRDALPVRMVDPRVFDGAARYHRGGIVGGAGDMPIWSQAGEGVFTPGQMRSLAPVADARPLVNVAVNVRNTAPGTRASADVRREPGGDLTLDIVIEQVEAGMARRIGRSEGLAPMLERRYGLNPAAGSLR